MSAALHGALGGSLQVTLCAPVSLYAEQVLMRGPNVADPRNPETIRKSHSTVALTRQAIHEGSVPRVPRPPASKGAQQHDATSPVAEIKVDAPGRSFMHIFSCFHLGSVLLRLTI